MYVAATNGLVCAGEFLSNCLSWQQNFLTATGVSKSNLCNLLQQRNSVADTKFFTNILLYTKWFVTTMFLATCYPICAKKVICCCNVLYQHVTKCVPTLNHNISHNQQWTLHILPSLSGNSLFHPKVDSPDVRLPGCKLMLPYFVRWSFKPVNKWSKSKRTVTAHMGQQPVPV